MTLSITERQLYLDLNGASLTRRCTTTPWNEAREAASSRVIARTLRPDPRASRAYVEDTNVQEGERAK